MSIDPTIAIRAGQAGTVDLAGLYRQRQETQVRQQQMDMQRQRLDFDRELQAHKIDGEKREALKEGLKDMHAAVRWADSPEKWAQVQQHYGRLDPTLTQIGFDQRETALVQLGQLDEYLKATEPEQPKSTSFLQELDALGIPRDSQAAKDLFYGKNSPSGYLLRPNGGGGGDDLPVISSPEEARRLAPGTRFKTPDGRIKRVPGGGAGNGVGGF